jgi:hypothetical protein
MIITEASPDGGRARKQIVLDEDDWKELFALYTSCTEYERQQIYQEGGAHDYRRTDLGEEYTYSAEKREYAVDAWRAVLFFLHRKGFALTNHRDFIPLETICKEFVTPPE